jgi:hypothetical protein
MTNSPTEQIDAYIAAAPHWQQPILSHVRNLVHKLVPEVEEAWKWSTPFFDYKGHFVGLMSLKDSITIRFARGGEMPEIAAGNDGGPGGAISRIKAMDDLPAFLPDLIKRAVYLNDNVPWPVAETVEREVPEDLQAALDQAPAANEIWTNWTTAKRKDYIVWITEAKKPETRATRITTAIEWIAQNKVRNWQSIEKMKAKGTR